MSDDIVWVNDYIPNMNIDDGDALESLISTIEHVSNLVKEGKWRDVTLERDESVEPQYASIFFQGLRPETERERETRLKVAEQMKERRAADKIAKEQRQRKEYERLKKKFEGKK